MWGSESVFEGLGRCLYSEGFMSWESDPGVVNSLESYWYISTWGLGPGSETVSDDQENAGLLYVALHQEYIHVLD